MLMMFFMFPRPIISLFLSNILFVNSNIIAKKSYFYALFLYFLIRAPPILSFYFTKRKEIKMKNDFSRFDFYISKENNNKTYFLKINGKWIEVHKEIFNIFYNDYKKIYRDNLRNKDKVIYFENLDLAEPYLLDHNYQDIVHNIYQLDMRKSLYKALNELDHEDMMIIYEIYFKNTSERQLATLLKTNRNDIHYKKQKILKKIKEKIPQ